MEYIFHPFPPALGYGLLDETSIVKEGDTWRAHYRIFDEEPVHHIVWQPGKCSIEDPSCYTVDSNLKQAVLRRFLSVEVKKDPAFQIWKEKLEQCNVRFNLGKPSFQTAYFPAGTLWVFRTIVNVCTDEEQLDSYWDDVVNSIIPRPFLRAYASQVAYYDFNDVPRFSIPVRVYEWVTTPNDVLHLLNHGKIFDLPHELEWKIGFMSPVNACTEDITYSWYPEGCGSLFLYTKELMSYLKKEKGEVL